MKEFSVIYSNNLGMGYVVPKSIDVNCFVDSIPVSIGGETIYPKEETTLLGYFDINPAMYVGMIANEMVFYLGETNDLFETRHYFISLIKVTETRIFSMFSHHAGRDFNLVNNKWK